MTLRRAVVTGGSRGIGHASAQALLRSGYQVTITGRRGDVLQQARQALASDGDVKTLCFDIADPEATATHLSKREVDVLVANVGLGFSGTVRNTSLADWQRVMDTNVTSVFVAIQSVLPAMLEHGWGRIVTIGSMASHQPIRFGAAYTASKHALLGLTRAVALDVAGSGVTANMVAPAFVRSDMTTENAGRIASATGVSVDQAEALLARMGTAGRLLEPGEVAEYVLRFVQDADGQLNGVSVAMGFDPLDRVSAPTLVAELPAR